ncbi:DUF1989 domain-containing protein [Euzebyella saccharophila]|uniref:DUF1989 domain-containing protein n=1 Tax=Euzebyella saccharophila TaxID=679664 RepID=A0ABV8JTH8_9FLAO|nr:urea carboxylase-associated family protein [Euzebyella saccharophila]
MNIKTIAPKSGASFKIKKGEYLKVICPDGEQVSDMVAFNADNTSEYMFNGKTFDYEESIFLTKGNSLYSNESNKMFEIIEDTCGTHDYLLAPCCNRTMEHFYQDFSDGPSCRKNLYKNLKRYDISNNHIPVAFNIFMNVPVSKNGAISVEPPLAKPGDYIILQAHMDCIVALTACSAASSNNGSYKPIQFQIRSKLK